jgi:hypothetical protein
MTITLDLPENLEHELAEEAERLGLSLPEYALRVLTAGRLVAPMLTNGAELVAYWQREGLIGARPEISDSQEYARRLRVAAERRQGS